MIIFFAAKLKDIFIKGRDYPWPKPDMSSGLLHRWKNQYAEGKLNAEPSKEAELATRVRELERLLGKVTLENEFLKKAVRNSLKQTEKRKSSLPRIAPLSKAFKGGANS